VPLVPSGQVVFVSNRDGKRALYTSSYDGSGQHLYVTKFTEGEQFDPIRSPNGDWTLFTSTNEKIRNSNGYEMGKLQLVSQDGLTVTSVSEDVAYSFSPLWSPNSQRFYFTGYTNPQMSQATYKVYDLSKKSTVDIGESANGLVFTPDSSTVLYSTLSSEDKPASDTVPASRVEYYSLKSLNVSTGERKTLSKHDQYLSEIRVASSGKSASFETVVDNARRRFEVSLTGDPAEHEVPVVLSTKRRYFFSPQHTQQAFIEERDGKKDVFVVDASEQNEKRLTTLGVVNDAFDPLWSDDGRYLTFAVKREGENGLYIVSLDGGDPKKITDFYAP
jgi:Tol biopolymer transport system component